MANELLLNVDRSNTSAKNTSTENGSTGKVEKKEGLSLFDTLMNEVKSKDTEDNSNKNSQTPSKETTNDTPTAEEKKLDVKKEEKSDLKAQKNIQIESPLTLEKKVDKNPESIQKLSENLIDMVVDRVEEKIAIKKENSSVDVEKNTEEKVITPKTIKLAEPVEIAKTVAIKKENSSVDVEKNTEENKALNNQNKTPENRKSTQVEEPVAIETKKENTNINVKELASVVQNDVEKKVTNNSTVSENKIQKEEKSETRVIDSVKTDETKNILSDKIILIEESTNTIDDEIKNFSKEPIAQKNDIQSIQKTISVESVTIKNSVQEIQQEISEIKNFTSNEKISDPEVKKVIENNEKIETKIQSNASVIHTTLDQIEGVVQSHIDSNKNDLKIDDKVQTIKDVVSDIKEQVSNIVIVKTTQYPADDNTVRSQQAFRGEERLGINSESVSIGKDSENNTKNPLLASMFLNAQRNTKEQISMTQVNDAKNTIMEQKTVQAVKEGASKLDLNFEDADLESTSEIGTKPTPLEVKKEGTNIGNLLNSQNLNRAILNQRIEANQMMQNQNQMQSSVPSPVQSQSNETAVSNSIKTNILEKTAEIVEMIVPKEAIQTIQSKIIGAQQKMGSFMSDVARNMYLNYQPPVTAFRVNLNPANLGSIAIVMKANKTDNSLSISMNLSNSSTMEAFAESKAVLQTAIQKQFSETSNITIDFGMQNQSSENTFNQSQQQQNKENQSPQNILEESEERIEEQEILVNNDYM